MNKPIHIKPAYYAYLFQLIKEIGMKNGYNFIVHGSMNRDLDIIAIPWIENPTYFLSVLKEICEALGVACPKNPSARFFNHSRLPINRESFIININRSGPWNDWVDSEFYIDISMINTNAQEFSP